MAAVDDKLAAIAAAVRAGSFGSLILESVEPFMDDDLYGDEVGVLRVTLADPDGPTWDADDLMGLRLFAQDRANEHDLGVTLYVRLAQVSDPPQFEDDEYLHLQHGA
jgi:hypothetical protein